jgi:rod shape-determining protein MreB and related proteins
MKLRVASFLTIVTTVKVDNRCVGGDCSKCRTGTHSTACCTLRRALSSLLRKEPTLDILHVGIDLGSMYTVVATSNGHRKVVRTEVGYPRDHFAAKHFGTDRVVGETLERNRLSLRTVRPLEKGFLKYDMPNPGKEVQEKYEQSLFGVQHLLEYIFSDLSGESDLQVRGVMGVPSQASVRNKKPLIELAEHWLKPVMLVPEPFAVGYGMDMLSSGIIVDIGAGTIDICHYNGSFPSEKDQITIPFGGDFVDEILYRKITESEADVLCSISVARTLKEKFGFVAEVAEPVIVRLPGKGRPPRDVEITGHLKLACLELGNAVRKGIESLLDSIQPENHASALANIVLAGGGSQTRGLETWLELALGDYGTVHVSKVPDCRFAGAVGALQLALQMPESSWSQLGSSQVTVSSNGKTQGVSKDTSDKTTSPKAA